MHTYMCACLYTYVCMYVCMYIYIYKHLLAFITAEHILSILHCKSVFVEVILRQWEKSVDNSCLFFGSSLRTL